MESRRESEFTQQQTARSNEQSSFNDTVMKDIEKDFK